MTTNEIEKPRRNQHALDQTLLGLNCLIAEEVDMSHLDSQYIFPEELFTVPVDIQVQQWESWLEEKELTAIKIPLMEMIVSIFFVGEENGNLVIAAIHNHEAFGTLNQNEDSCLCLLRKIITSSKEQSPNNMKNKYNQNQNKHKEYDGHKLSFDGFNSEESTSCSFEPSFYEIATCLPVCDWFQSIGFLGSLYGYPINKNFEDQFGDIKFRTSDMDCGLYDFTSELFRLGCSPSPPSWNLRSLFWDDLKNTSFITITMKILRQSILRPCEIGMSSEDLEYYNYPFYDSKSSSFDNISFKYHNIADNNRSPVPTIESRPPVSTYCNLESQTTLNNTALCLFLDEVRSSDLKSMSTNIPVENSNNIPNSNKTILPSIFNEALNGIKRIYPNQEQYEFVTNNFLKNINFEKLNISINYDICFQFLILSKKHLILFLNKRYEIIDSNINYPALTKEQIEIKQKLLHIINKF